MRVGTCSGAQKWAYLPEAYIDTVVQRAFFGFVAATQFSGSLYHQKQAIDDAKRVAQRLKRLARGDPNEKYVLWRVNELEHQIFLEEKEVLLKQMRRGQKIMNQLVVLFNKETGKRRPDFQNLHEITEQMAAVDCRKGDELDWLVRDRSKNISREVMYSIEKALISRDLSAARKELDYCNDNADYLTIQNSRHALLESRTAHLTDLETRKTVIKNELESIQQSLGRNMLRPAQFGLRRVRHRIGEVRSQLTYEGWHGLHKRLQLLDARLIHKEDSLVSVNMHILQSDGVDQAIDFMEFVLRRCGVRTAKIAKVDQAVMATPAPYENKLDEGVMREIDALAGVEEGDNGFSLAGVRAAAMKKARHVADSIHVVEEEKARVAAGVRAREEARQQKVRKKAEKKLDNIYALLRKRKAKKAAALFTKKRDMLSKSIPGTELAIVEKELRRAQDELARGKSRKRERAAPDPAQVVSASTGNDGRLREEARGMIVRIYSLLEQGKITQARELFRLHRKSLDRHAYPEAYAMVSATLERATVSETPTGNEATSGVNPYEQYDQTQKQSRKDAEQKIVEIYTLLEGNKVVAAYNLFQRSREPLRKFVCEEAFATLQSTVAQAYEFREK